MYSSPDPRIQQMLSDYPPTLETALQAFIVREKYLVGTKIMPGLWSGFLNLPTPQVAQRHALDIYLEGDGTFDLDVTNMRVLLVLAGHHYTL